MNGYCCTDIDLPDITFEIILLFSDALCCFGGNIREYVYISQQMLKNVYMRRFTMFSSRIVIHGVSRVLAVATHNYSPRPHRHFEKSAFYFDLAMFSCEKARSMYTNLDFLLILYTFPAVLQVFLRDVYLLIKTFHIIQSPVQAGSADLPAPVQRCSLLHQGAGDPGRRTCRISFYFIP